MSDQERPAPLTAETITHDQIASLREACALVGDDGQVELCYVAMGLAESRTGVTQAQAKKACADIINALPPEMFA